MNGSLLVDFADFVHDPDGDELTLSCDGENNINVEINGLNVLFTATPNWHGSENLVFTVSDGTDSAQAAVEVLVNLNWLGAPELTMSLTETAPPIAIWRKACVSRRSQACRFRHLQTGKDRIHVKP